MKGVEKDALKVENLEPDGVGMLGVYSVVWMVEMLEPYLVVWMADNLVAQRVVRLEIVLASCAVRRMVQKLVDSMVT
jgi:hypothetical protein